MATTIAVGTVTAMAMSAANHAGTVPPAVSVAAVNAPMPMSSAWTNDTCPSHP